jgi:hypothetical protein
VKDTFIPAGPHLSIGCFQTRAWEENRRWIFIVYFFGGLECIGHYFACRPFCVFERSPDSNPESCAVASRRATDLATAS